MWQVKHSPKLSRNECGVRGTCCPVGEMPPIAETTTRFSVTVIVLKDTLIEGA